jgi:hypothetical protein
MLSDYELSDLLIGAHTIAVVGLSDKPERASHAVASYLKRHGYRIIPVNPNLHAPVLGEQPYANLRDIPETIDIVNVFRRSEYTPEIVEDAIMIGAHTVWMQAGVSNEAAARRARQAGLHIVMDRCIAVEHRRLSRYADVLQ